MEPLTKEDSCVPCKFSSAQEKVLINRIDFKHQEMELERKICIQKLKLSSELFKLAEKEQEEKHYCKCKGFCNIFHKKHTWKKSIIQELQSKSGFYLIDYECKECDNNFLSKEDLMKHVELKHTKPC